MRKQIIYALVLMLTLTVSSCKNQLEDAFQNPDASTQQSLPGFFADLLNNDRVRPSYWHYRTFILLHSAVYTQSASFGPSNTMYQQSDGYLNDYWRDFYAPGVLGIYRAMEVAYNGMDETEKSSNEVFMQAARVVLYDEASKLVDNFGDIPFSEAGSLPSSSNIQLGKFDDQIELYNSFISGLAEASSFFGTAAQNAGFSKADILNSGNMAKWQRYANSLRLRLLMRISNYSESTASAAIMELLNNPATYPLVDGDNQANYSPLTSDILLRPLTTYTGSLRDALLEGANYYATDHMLNDVMLPANDPRIPVFYDKFGQTVNSVFIPNTEYKAMPIEYTTNQFETEFSKFSILDSATFFDNPSLPGIVISASEVNFLKAEAFQRWGNTASAQTAYETALKQSVTFYYYLNNLNTTGIKTEVKPTDAIINNFVNSSTVSYVGSATDKLSLIYTQKWLHFGFLQAQQGWAEYRRTGYPQLTFQTANLASSANPPVRLTYPSSEITYNNQNYQAVKDKDTRDTKIFWDVN
ncbi:SusD/RagB family nutrient-binding outer membrane lipoprotein [Sphingobacterium bambusae]|uniref:SusD/RagB family nutrient-binding outer membrane lipoprotein n=1 Tax=Sphingobacterium bambusae TaxID=662858 RepID=A0ABW6BH72_9SPHI|nr:SusD/RagB family nutrient-binding outer membrane lipoprotein [Sphingobacterium bambusae]WPL50444.1 SusD/RagB family nutrient-binding outer membrane lipoprotein [Sphingobacterium bambusae]